MHKIQGEIIFQLIFLKNIIINLKSNNFKYIIVLIIQTVSTDRVNKIVCNSPERRKFWKVES